MAGRIPPGSFSAIVPAWQEAGRIGATVRALQRLEPVGEVVVVDDGSRDGTAAEAQAAGARVVRLPGRRGKGVALLAGAGAARHRYLLLCDADLGDSAAGLAPLMGAVAGGGADLAIALPVRGGGAGLGLVRALAAAGVGWLGGCRLKAPLSGQRALVADLAQPLLAGPPCGFGAEVRMDVRALRMGLRVVEVPLAFDHRYSGWSLWGVLHRGRQMWDVARTLASLAREGTGAHRPGGGDEGHGGPTG